MNVAVDEIGSVDEPYLEVHRDHEICLPLRPGFIDIGLKRSAIERVPFAPGEMALATPHMEEWIGSADLEYMTVGISEAAINGASDGLFDRVELPPQRRFVDGRVAALLTAVNAERLTGFTSGRLFLDSVEQAIATALINGHAVRRPTPRYYRSGLTPARLRRVTELIDAKIDDELTLEDLSDAAQLSRSHFSQMFRKTTGESPHQFVLRHRVEHAKQILRSPHLRVLDVAIACGFKTQQHFARVFRQMCGISPTEYRQELFQ